MIQRHPTGRYCARCTYPMDHLPAGKVWVDHCYRCGGSFLEGGRASEAVGEFADPAKWRAESFARPPLASTLFCPSGHGRMWSYLLRAEAREVEIEGCTSCQGMWLDAREAQALSAITTEAHHEGPRPGSSKGDLGVTAMYIVQLATMLPIEVNNPVRRKAVLVRILVALNLLVFVVQFAMAGAGRIEWFARTFGVVPDDVLHGRHLFSLVTYAFLHGGFMHIVGNLYTLWIFGDNVEDRIGRVRFAILYLATAISGGLAYALGHIGGTGVMVGASGAISGLMGAYLVLFPRVKLWLVVFFVPLKLRAYWYMLIWVALNALLILDPKSKTAWEAHFGGFVLGVVLGYLLRPRGDDAMPPTMRLPPMGAR